jgi:excisionase family DNA binding protein
MILTVDVPREIVETIACRALELMREEQQEPSDGWLDAAGAAEYLGMPRTALHKLTAARSIPFEQEGAGCKLYFKRSDLDAWRRQGGGRAPYPECSTIGST